MFNAHEPHDAFVERLAETIGADVRMRNRAPVVDGWRDRLLQSPMKLAAAAAVLVIVSMSAGAIVVASVYEAQTNESRETLLQSYKKRWELAAVKVENLTKIIAATEQRVSSGVETQESVLEARSKVAEATAQYQILGSQIAEIQITGREPVVAVSAPLIGGRDFVIERWYIEMSVPVAALELEQARLKAVERRVAVGAATTADVETTRANIVEMEVARNAFRRKIEIRMLFLRHEWDAAFADLHILEVEGDQRRQSLSTRVDFARRIVQDLKTRVEIGTAAHVELATADVRLQELQLDLAKVDADLAAIRRQIAQRK